MKQSRLASFIESAINILVGFGISLGAQMIFLPMIGVPINHMQNFIFACIMTVISLARSFILRRIFEALHIRRSLSPFMQAVIAECWRHREVEGYDTAHDDSHADGELARAGAAYALFAPSHTSESKARGIFALAISVWPWRKEDWKPYGFRRDLVRACSLIVAEGERFDRTRTRKQPSNLPAKPMPITDIKAGLK